MVSDLIIGVIVDVYGHVLVEYLNGLGVGFIPGTTWDFVIPDATEFVVLDPKVASSSSSAAGNRSRAASPGVRPPRASAVRAPGNSPTPIVPAPAASDLAKNERRLIERFRDLTLFSKLSSSERSSFLLESCAVGMVSIFMLARHRSDLDCALQCRGNGVATLPECSQVQTLVINLMYIC
jgi:hypothetical protein